MVRAPPPALRCPGATTEPPGGEIDFRWQIANSVFGIAANGNAPRLGNQGETVAYYGRTVYTPSVVEVALAHVLLFAQFMKKARDDYIATKGKGFDRKQYERDFDALMDDQFTQTMGNLMRRVEKFSGFEGALKDRISDAKKRRDFLTHHYWRERSITLPRQRGASECARS
ncbi:MULTISPECIES: hypothetical protein [Bradyrhizobium]|uniref:Uncharacterized protein n=1 Tax=Bradyrhizobium frederickii TaxID=2560054 RepID=A0A4Y9NP17_9BRAD|nr:MULTISPECIES: hypothetical protein [Bradyrhizobium]TFV30275.1 hypothetical protein E4K66_35790 [Bradyrhizobium frederickii]TFV68503.1 hypothetical protein E4K64_36660 [Bradyrhizobium frederickii]